MKVINKVSSKRKTVSVINFLDMTFKSKNARLNQRGLKKGYGQKVYSVDLGADKYELKGLYHVLGKTYLYDSTGWIFEIGQDELVPKFMSGSSDPVMTSVYFQGQEKILAIISGDKGYVLHDKSSDLIDIPTSDFAVMHNGRLFLAKGAVLNFSKEYDPTDFTVRTDLGGSIKFPESYGDIVGISANKTLDIIFEHNIFTLNAQGEQSEFAMTKINVNPQKIARGSVASVCGKTVFIDNGKLAVLENGNLTYPKGFTNEIKLMANGKCAVDGSAYLMPVVVDGENLLLRYDLISGEKCLISNLTNAVANGGYAINTAGQLVSILDQGKCNISWQSRQSDFSIPENKSLTKLTFRCKGSAIVKVKGDCGERVFLINQQENIKKLRLCSKDFVINIESDDQDFEIEQMDLEFMLKE